MLRVLAIWASVVACAACGTVPPTRVIGSGLTFSSPPAIYVIAAKQKSQIIESLVGAKLDIVEDLIDSSHQLRVTLGVDKGFQSCGTLNNLKYALRKNGSTVIELRGRGWTGQCRPSVFDEMSRELEEVILEKLETQERT